MAAQIGMARSGVIVYVRMTDDALMEFARACRSAGATFSTGVLKGELQIPEQANEDRSNNGQICTNQTLLTVSGKDKVNQLALVDIEAASTVELRGFLNRLPDSPVRRRIMNELARRKTQKKGRRKRNSRPWAPHGLPAPFDGINAYEVYATVEQLAELVRLPSVTDWHSIRKTIPLVRAQGQTKKPGSHNMDRHK